MKKLAWAARGLATVSGALLVGALVAVPASADDNDSSASQSGTCTLRSVVADAQDTDRNGDHSIDSAVVDYSGSPLFGTIFRVSTAEGHAFLHDSRVPAAWIDLTAVRGTPTCVVDATVAVEEAVPGSLHITVVAPDGVAYGATCTTSATPFTTSNIGTECGIGFTPIY